MLAITAFASYVLGLARDHFFAQTFGASRALDAYNAAFLFPDLLFNILIAGGIAAAFVPILTELLHRDKAKANDYVNSVITAATGTMLIVGVIIVIYSQDLSARSSLRDSVPTDRHLVANIIHVLALSPIFFAASNAIGAMLITNRRFLFYGLSPVLYNLGIILGTLLLAPRFGIMGVAFGTLFGAILHLLARFADAWWHGFRFQMVYCLRSPEFRKTVRLMIPKMFGHPIELATFWGFTAIASLLLPVRWPSSVLHGTSRAFLSASSG